MRTAAAFIALLLSTAALAEDWPQWRGPDRDGVWKESGVIRKFESPELKIKWRAPISSGYSGPTVAKGRVYVTDRVVEPEEQERVHCFDAETGKPVWTHAYPCEYKGVSYPNGPRASVTIHDGRAYSLGSMANLYCFDAVTGRVNWKKDLFTLYSVRMPDWGIAAAPLIEGDNLIVVIGGDAGASVVALDRKTGEERWKALADKACYSSPVIVDQAGKRVLVLWTADRIVGLDPSTGSLHWEYSFPSVRQIDGVITPVVKDNRLVVSSVSNGILMLKLASDKLAVEKGWHRKRLNPQAEEGMHSLVPNPLILGDTIYGIDYYGELRSLDAATGDRKWSVNTIIPRNMWAAGHLVQNGGLTWIFTEKGQLIISRLTPQKYEEIGRAQLIKPTTGINNPRPVTWAHPAFANKHVFARNDDELVCASLKESGS